MIDYGETFSSQAFLVHDSAGDLADAGTFTGTITLPDATTVAATITHSATGTYYFDYLTTQAGRHTFIVSATGGALGAGVLKDSGEFSVSAADPGFIVSLEEVKRHLGKTAATDNEELRTFIAAATRIVEDDPEIGVGPVVVRTWVERHESGARVFLNRVPVVSVTSVVPWLTNGTTYTVGDLRTEAVTGVVERKDGGTFTGGPFEVTYKAGRPVVPANIRLAALEMIKHWWESQRGQAGRPALGGDGSPLYATASGYAIPNKVAQMLRADRQIPFPV